MRCMTFLGSISSFEIGRTLAVQWWRVCLPMQETRVQSQVWEDDTCCGASKSMGHKYRARAVVPGGHKYRARAVVPGGHKYRARAVVPGGHSIEHVSRAWKHSDWARGHRYCSPHALEPALCNKRSLHDEKPTQATREQPPLSTLREKPEQSESPA